MKNRTRGCMPIHVDGRYVVKDSKVEDDSRYLWRLSSRGGNMFYLGNKYVNEDSAMELYAVYDATTARVQFYTDLLTHGYQVLRFTV